MKSILVAGLPFVILTILPPHIRFVNALKLPSKYHPRKLSLCANTSGEIPFEERFSVYLRNQSLPMPRPISHAETMYAKSELTKFQAKEAFEREAAFGRESFERQAALARESFERQAALARESFERQAALVRDTDERKVASARESFERQAALARESFERQAALARETDRRRACLVIERIEAEEKRAYKWMLTVILCSLILGYSQINFCRGTITPKFKEQLSSSWKQLKKSNVRHKITFWFS